MVGCGGAGGGHVITLAGKGESRKAEEGVVWPCIYIAYLEDLGHLIIDTRFLLVI